MESEYVTLNIEGRIVQTKLSTLTSIKNSYFSNILRGQWTKHLDRNGHLFIDRNSDTFMVILGYLRDGLDYPLPEDKYTLRLIEHDARLFGLMEFAAEVERRLHKLESSTSTTQIAKASPPMAPPPDTEPKAKPSLPITHPFPILSDTLPPPLITLDSKDDSQKAIKLQDIALKKLPKKEKKSLIGRPSNFEHVVHIGWNSDGKRVVVDNSQRNEHSIKAIIAATEAQTAAQTPVYSMVTANGDQDNSESVEVFFAGTTFRPINGNSSSITSNTPDYNEAGYDNALYELANRKYEYTKPVKKRIAVTDM
uniref:CRIB domain-containing protein n=1 Tax=Syphacia muris TaxID=451379 RepID=A0A0N5AC49_9BILA